MSISRRRNLYGRPPSIFIQISLTSSTSLLEEERCGGGERDLLPSILPEPLTRPTSSFVPSQSTSSSYFLLPVDCSLPFQRSALVFPLRGSALRAKALARSDAAECFWPFSPEWRIRPKNTLGRVAAFRGGAFLRPCFLGLFFLKKINFFLFF